MAEETAPYDPEPVVTAYMAESASEAMVIRGLLESAGISSPGSVSTDPFPIPENPESPHGMEIIVLESQADEARAIIEEYQKGNRPTAAGADA
jgi:Putative prokaryotic signal transducing protein